MNRNEIIDLLNKHGYRLYKHVRPAQGGVYVEAEKRIPMYEFDYNEFVFRILEGKVDVGKIHHLDPWTFTIECE